ncbi:efflux RND transporter periplasmic adaptor subunit [Plebeiibacterium marinum]|uniref:Efflux RND transporter periplasmic adaptor subunit n=1 Tax=Plebeiibacterium marinum TaxID=2992111 RepID=A0AAE3MH34_9BACT|nr:efflux RND transporter periplasmic adaptor subunit [Plebeiobacterium marinum]MCW3807360.1 efflux RND transporter periplasmic adaptor subunit [Plebeiobacterium marinum]
MKKIIRTSTSITIIAVICLLIFLQLKGNKENNQNITELANIKGQHYPVKIITAKPSMFASSINTNGFLQSYTDLNLVAETNGRIVKIYKRKGEHIQVGDTIAKVDDEMLRAQLNATKASYDQLHKEVERFTKLANQNAVTSQQLDEIKLNYETTKAQYISAKKQLNNTCITSPVDGYIEQDFIEIGQFVGNGSVVCNIIDSKNLKLQIEIAEENYKNIGKGMEVEISTSTFPDRDFTGTISYIGKKAGYGNSFNAEVKINNNNEGLLKAGMYVTAKIEITGNTEEYYIPRKAISGSLKDASIYLIVDNKAVLSNVTTGKVINDQVQIINGLKSGDKVVIEGNYSIYNNANVKILN